MRDPGQRLLDAFPLSQLAWASVDELTQHAGIGLSRAAAIAGAFEIGRRGAWMPPKRGDPLVADFESSDLTWREFATERGISPSDLRYSI